MWIKFPLIQNVYLCHTWLIWLLCVVNLLFCFALFYLSCLFVFYGLMILLQLLIVDPVSSFPILGYTLSNDFAPIMFMLWMSTYKNVSLAKTERTIRILWIHMRSTECFWSFQFENIFTIQGKLEKKAMVLCSIPVLKMFNALCVNDLKNFPPNWSEARGFTSVSTSYPHCIVFWSYMLLKSIS